MGSVTNLKENKTIFIPCDCKSEILVVEYDHQLQLADFAIYQHISYNNRMSIWQRLRYCCRVLFGYSPYSDQIVLDHKQLKELRDFVREILL